MDFVVANKYLIDRLKEGKEKEKEVRDYENNKNDYRYIGWQKKKQEKQRIVEEDQLAKK